MTDTTFVVMWGDMPQLVTDDLSVAQAVAIAANVKYLPADDRPREHRWDQEGNDTLVLREKSPSSGRWVKANYMVVTVPRNATICTCRAETVHQRGCQN